MNMPPLTDEQEHRRMEVVIALTNAHNAGLDYEHLQNLCRIMLEDVLPDGDRQKRKMMDTDPKLVTKILRVMTSPVTGELTFNFEPDGFLESPAWADWKKKGTEGVMIYRLAN